MILKVELTHDSHQGRYLGSRKTYNKEVFFVVVYRKNRHKTYWLTEKKWRSLLQVVKLLGHRKAWRKSTDFRYPSRDNDFQPYHVVTIERRTQEKSNVEK